MICNTILFVGDHYDHYWCFAYGQDSRLWLDHTKIRIRDTNAYANIGYRDSSAFMLTWKVSAWAWLFWNFLLPSQRRRTYKSLHCLLLWVFCGWIYLLQSLNFQRVRGQPGDLKEYFRQSVFPGHKKLFEILKIMLDHDPLLRPSARENLRNELFHRKATFSGSASMCAETLWICLMWPFTKKIIRWLADTDGLKQDCKINK